MSFQHTLLCITPDEEVDKWGSLSMQRIDGYLQTAGADPVKLAGLLIRCPKLCVCLLVFVSQFSPGPLVFCPSQFSTKFAMEQSFKNYRMSSPSIETEFGIYREDLQASHLSGTAALLALLCRLSSSEEGRDGSAKHGHNLCACLPPVDRWVLSCSRN